MSAKATTRHPLQQNAARADVCTIDARHPAADVLPVSEAARWAARLNRRLKAAARQAFRLMGED
jgi:hypothetical protein